MPRPVHFEIHADDCARAMRFYQTVFGWEFKKIPGPKEYWLIMTGSGSVGIDGGMLPRCGTPPQPGQGMNAFICTVDVADVAAIEQQVLAAGGTIALPKQEIPGVGQLLYGKDPEGNIFGCMQFLPRAMK